MANKRDQFIKLRSTGLDPVSARKQVYGDVAPATPAPTTVTPATPAQTAPVTPTPDINSDANRLARAQQGGSQRLIENLTPATPTPVAPVTPTTPTEPIAPVAPVAPTPVAPVTPAPVTPAPAPATSTPPEVPMAAAPIAPVAPVPVPTTTPTTTPKVEKPADNRQAQINANLTEGFQTNPSLFSDRTAFDTAYNYATKTPEERAVLDSFYASKQPTIQNMYSAIASKADIPVSVKNTPAYKIANIQYQNAKNFAGMTPAQLSKEMDSANIVEGSTTWENMMAMNPKLAKDAQNLRIVNGSKTNLFSTEKAPDGSTVKVNNLEKLFGKEFAETFGTFMDEMYKVQTPEEIKAQIYTPEVQKAQEQAQKIESEMNVIQDALDAVDKEVEKELAGSGASASRIALEKARRNEDLTDQYNSLQRKYTTQYNIQSELIKQNTATMQEAQQQKQAKNAALLPFVQAQAKTQMEKIAQEQALNDPATQIGATMDEFAKLGIVAQGSLAQKVAEANAFIANGGTLGEYVNKLRSDFMAKPEYKKIQELQSGQLSDFQKFQMQTAVESQRDVRNFNQQKELAQFNNDINRQEFLFKIENDPEQRAKVQALEKSLQADKSLFDVLGKNVGTYEGNRGYDLAGAIGDPLPAGGNWTVKSIDTAGEQVGSIFIGGKGSKPYGNTVVMEDENGNQIRYSHLDSIGVKPGDVLGFGDIVGTRGNTGNVMGRNGEKLTAEQLKAGRGAHLDVEIKSNGKLLSQEEQVKYLKGLKAGGAQPLTDKQYTQYNQAASKFVADPSVKAFESALAGGGDLIASLKSANGPGDVGAVFGFMKSLDPASVVKEGEFALAAKSAGVWEQFKNIPANKLEGTILTEDQRKAFGKLAFEYIKQKGRLYDIKYNDFTKILKNQGIPDTYYPTKMTDFISQFEGGEQTNQTSSTGLTGKDLFSEWSNFKK